jgi:hypothetical protein
VKEEMVSSFHSREKNPLRRAATCSEAAWPPYVREGFALPEEGTNLSRGSAALSPRSPPDEPFDIHMKRFILQLTSLPATNARPAIIDRSLDEVRANRVLMNVVHLLHERRLACQKHGVRVRLPERILVMPLPLGVAQFVQ